MATEKILQGLCDLRWGKDDPECDWNEEACVKFNEKHKQTVDRNIPHYCLKVCGNCEYFTVAEFEVYPEQIPGEGTAIGRVG